MDSGRLRNKRAILIAGPTASGKSGLAVALAERLGGMVVNADSMQVYRDLRILTARPSTAEMARAPHHLFGHVDAAEAYSVGRWLDEVGGVLEEASSSRPAVFVGGTGLYFKALTQGLSAMPAVPAVVRDRVRLEAQGVPVAVLHARLAARDPVVGARLRPTDPQRILRALEVLEATGQSISAFQSLRGTPLLNSEETLAIALAPDRVDLRARIDRRLDAMMAEGALDEVAALQRRGLAADLPAMRALAVPELLPVLADPNLLGTALQQAKTATWHYARRQMTFLRHQLPDFAAVEPNGAEAAVLTGGSE